MPTSNPEASLEQLLITLWEDVLETTVKPNDNFFSLGGNSIKAVRVMNRLQEEMNAIFHPASIFDAPTVSTLSMYCRTHYPHIFNKNAPRTHSSGQTINDAQIELARNTLLHRNSAENVQIDTTQPNNQPAIFILSPPRSGSTLLRVILGGSPVSYTHLTLPTNREV